MPAPVGRLVGFAGTGVGRDRIAAWSAGYSRRVPVVIGTSGWQYKDWRGRFYPPGLPQKRWLEYYVEHFATVEVNNTFYRLPPPETFAGWRGRLPQGFVMTLKVSRYLTHIKQLRDPEEPVSRFLRHAAPLGDRCGPLLIQLPPTLSADVPRLAHALDQFPRDRRVAVEFRHQSWFSDEVAAVLAERNVALCLADRFHRPLGPVWRTADWGYVRFHEGAADPHPHYSTAALREWAERLAGCWEDTADVFAYFNNDPGCYAVADAIDFAACVAGVGRTPTRTPGNQFWSRDPALERGMG